MTISVALFLKNRIASSTNADWHRPLVLTAGLLLASPSVVRANVVGSDFQTFNPTTNGIDFVSVQSAQTLRPGVFNLGLFGNYAVNAIPEFKDGEPYNYPRGSTRNTGIFSDFNMGLGLTSFLDIGLSFPAILKQSVKDDTSRLEYDATGINEFRVNSKLKVLGNAQRAVALVGTININRIDNNPYSGTPTGPIYTLELVGHSGFGDANVGLNAGYRKKNPGERLAEAVAEPFRDQLIGSTAVSYLFKSIDTKLIAEFYGSQPVSSKATPSEVLQRSGEVLLGVKHDVTSEIALHAGGTVGVIDSPATPDWRLYAGINWNAGPLWRTSKPRQAPTARKLTRPQPKPTVAPTPEPTAPVEVAVIQEPRETFVLENILFANDSSTQVISGALDELKELIEHLRTIPAWSRLVVEGHTDSVSSDEYNNELSMRRASSVRAYLIKHMGLDPSKISAVGYGESRPIADNNNYQGRQQNRRVEIKIFD